MNHCDPDKPHFRLCCMFITATQPTVLCQPGVCSLNDPTDGELDEPLGVLRSGDDVQLASRLPLFDPLGKADAFVGSVSKNGLQLRVIIGVHLLEAFPAALDVE